MTLTALNKRILFIGQGPIINTYLRSATVSSFKIISNVQNSVNFKFTLPYHQGVSCEFQDIDCVVISTRLELMDCSSRNLLFSLIGRLGRLENIQKVIILSSVSVYGDKSNKCDEKTPTYGTSKYAKSKLELEELARAKFSFANVTAMRISNVFGNSLFKDVINRMVNSIADFREVLLPTEDNYRDFIYIDDLCEVLHFILGSEKLLPDLINVGRGESFSIYQLAENVIENLRELYGQITIKKNLVSFHKNSFINTQLLRSIFPKKQDEFHYQLSRYLAAERDKLLASERGSIDFI